QLNVANLDLRRSEAFLDSVIENIPDMVFVKDARTLRFVRLNRAGEALLGISRSDYVGRTDHDFFPVEEADFFTLKDREVIAHGHVVDIPEEPIETPSGRRILHTKKLPVVDDDGQPIYLLGISEDITDRKHANDAIEAARVEADRANRAKTEFLSRMSHELRTPLNAILGFSQLLEMDELNADQRENVAYISQAGRHLLELINEVLDISRIESGQISISREPVAVDEVVHEVATLVRPLADARGVTVEVVAIEPGAFVLADRQRLNQVLLNLLSNAVKYNREGGSIRVETRPADDGMLRITVADTGFGIPPEYHDRLFRPFDRLGADRSSVEGTGMGSSCSTCTCPTWRATRSSGSCGRIPPPATCRSSSCRRMRNAGVATSSSPAARSATWTSRSTSATSSRSSTGLRPMGCRRDDRVGRFCADLRRRRPGAQRPAPRAVAVALGLRQCPFVPCRSGDAR